MKIKKCTITGADDNSDIFELLKVTREYPFVEWGMLISKSSQGGRRFPYDCWMTKLVTESLKNQLYPLSLSMHICGAYLRDDVCFGDWRFLKKMGNLPDDFQRIQLNFHGEPHKVNDAFYDGLKNLKKQIIFQIDNKNTDLFIEAIHRGVDCVPFYDLSHGAGVLPDHWPSPMGEYCGYARGLSPDNIDKQLKLIENIVLNNAIWIDCETRVRTNGKLDFDKVRTFLSKVEKFNKTA